MWAIEIKQISRRYFLYQEAPTLIKDVFLRPVLNRSRPHECWALRDISWRIKQGETVGLLGENGAGKSTLLKILAGITKPTTGSITVNGRVGALLELGTGFHSELTGRENVLLNASLLGIRRKEVEAKLKDIVSFAELESFFDVPVKTYSSGMFVRLGFSAAMAMDPDVLIIDEALAVGDIRFQQKCMRRLAEFKRENKTLVVVSHDLGLIKALCDTAVCLHHGSIVDGGDAGEVVDRYVLRMTDIGSPQRLTDAAVGRQDSKLSSAEWSGEPFLLGAVSKPCGFPRSGTRAMVIKEVHLIDDARQPVVLPEFGQVVNLEVAVEAQQDCPRLTVAFYVKNHSRLEIIGTNTDIQGKPVLQVARGERYVFRFRFELRLKPGMYTVTVIAANGPEAEHYYDWIEDAISFELLSPHVKLHALYGPPIEVTLKSSQSVAW